MSDNNIGLNPCQQCGACCASYRVSFYAGEMDDMPGGRVPSHLVDKVNDVMACMRGTERQPVRCVALQGTIGESVGCAIYEFRSSTCRDFSPYSELGQGDDACADARRRHGLPPLPSLMTRV